MEIPPSLVLLKRLDWDWSRISGLVVGDLVIPLSKLGMLGCGLQGQVQALLPLPGELHLTPLHGILQLRPSFSYLDKADAKHREREAANEGEPADSLWSGWARLGLRNWSDCGMITGTVDSYLLNAPNSTFRATKNVPTDC